MSMIDRFTRWVELAPVADIRAETVADALVCHLVLRHGCPQQLLSDRGSQFTSRLFRRVPQRLRIDIIFTTAYHPQTNGQVERFNSSIAACLSAFVKEDQSDWDCYLQAVAFAYCTSLVDVVQNTPYYLVYGRDARLPSDVIWGTPSDIDDDEEYGIYVTRRLRRAFELARSSQSSADAQRKLYYDACHEYVLFEPGSLVLLHSNVRKPGLSPKLRQHFDGPYRVQNRLSDSTYELVHVESGSATLTNVQQIIRYYSSSCNRSTSFRLHTFDLCSSFSGGQSAAVPLRNYFVVRTGRLTQRRRASSPFYSFWDRGSVWKQGIGSRSWNQFFATCRRARGQPVGFIARYRTRRSPRRSYNGSPPG